MNFFSIFFINYDLFLNTLVNKRIMVIIIKKNIVLITTSPKFMKKSSTSTECTKILSLSHYLTIGD